MKKLKCLIILGWFFLVFLTPHAISIVQPVGAVSPMDPGLQGFFTLSNKADSQGAVVNSKAHNSNVSCEDINSTENFQWQLVYYGKYSNDYILINQYNMLLLGIEGNSTSEGANIVTNPLAKNTWSDWAIRDEFLFEFEASGPYYTLKSCLSDLYVTQDGGGNVIQTSYTGTDNQLWEITAIELSIPNYEDLVWTEEFNYNGLPDDKYWSFEQIWVNNEKQTYTINDTDNCYVENDYLKITALKEQYGATQYTSARINTRGKFNFTYGRVEGRIKVAGGRGTWPAFWMMPESFDPLTNPWPDCGEIDIMEYVGYDADHIHAHCHNELYSGLTANDYGASVEVDNVSTMWHIYGMKWNEERLIFYVDDWVYFVYENISVGKKQYPYIEPFYIILNLAIGGNWGGAQGIDDSIFPVSYYVDWIRVFREGDDTTAPAQVMGLTATATSRTQVNLAWEANTEFDLDHYNIYRDNVKIAEVNTSVFVDTELSARTIYTYQVTAVDIHGNEGIKSDPINVETRGNQIPGFPVVAIFVFSTVVVIKISHTIKKKQR